jgi:hypothetical protein
MYLRQEFIEKLEIAILMSNSIDELKCFIIGEYKTLKNSLATIGVKFGEGYNEDHIMNENLLIGVESYFYDEYLLISSLWQYIIHDREIGRDKKYHIKIDIYMEILKGKIYNLISNN